MIHGEKDAYIGPGDRPGPVRLRAGEPKEFWIVPEGAKHNRCREKPTPPPISNIVSGFFRRYAPRGCPRSRPGPPAFGRPSRRSSGTRPSDRGGLIGDPAPNL